MRKKPAFASLSNEEYEQLGEEVCRDTYEKVRERVNKPRPEGLGLNISISPLQTLHAKKMRIAEINQRVKEGRRTAFSPSIRCHHLWRSRRTRGPGYQAILETTRDLALSGDNTPADLLAPQRLADFPARAEHREHKRQLELRKEEHGKEKHVYKVAVEKERAAHKLDMEEHRNRMNEERLTLANRSFELREKQLALKSTPDHNRNPNHQPVEDDLGPIAMNWAGVEARAKRKYGPIPILDDPPVETASPESKVPTTENPASTGSAPSAVNVPSPLPQLPPVPDNKQPRCDEPRTPDG